MKVGIIGLGYVGLPLGCLFAKFHVFYGFDIDVNKINLLKQGINLTRLNENFHTDKIFLTTNIKDLQVCDFLKVTIPTDIDVQNQPDLSPLKIATGMIGGILKKG